MRINFSDFSSVITFSAYEELGMSLFNWSAGNSPHIPIISSNLSFVLSVFCNKQHLCSVQLLPMSAYTSVFLPLQRHRHRCSHTLPIPLCGTGHRTARYSASGCSFKYSCRAKLNGSLKKAVLTRGNFRYSFLSDFSALLPKMGKYFGKKSVGIAKLLRC